MAASAGLALAAIFTWGVVAAHDVAIGSVPWSRDVRLATIVLATCSVVAAGLSRGSVLLVYLTGWFALELLPSDKIAKVWLVVALLAWTAAALLVGQRRRGPADANQRAWLVLLPMLAAGAAAFVSPALLLSQWASASGRPASGPETIVSVALPLLLAAGAILCGFSAGRLVGRDVTVSRRLVWWFGVGAAVLLVAAGVQAVWGFLPVVVPAMAMGGPIAVVALARGIPRSRKRTRLSSDVAAGFSLMGMLAIGGAVITFAAAVAVTALLYRVEGVGLLATPGAILLGVATGYVIWQAARERILDPAFRATDASSAAASADENGLANTH